jgi:hypothetical protein
MGAAQFNEEDVVRAHEFVNAVLKPAYPRVEVRHRVEQTLGKCRPGSRRYAFWRLILAMVVSESASAGRSRPAGRGAARRVA